MVTLAVLQILKNRKVDKITVTFFHASVKALTTQESLTDERSTVVIPVDSNLSCANC